jgi:recombination protein RecR
MSYSSKILSDAVDALSSLPSVGKKSAMRLALHLAADSNGKKQKLIQSILALANDLKICKECHCYSDTDICTICSNPNRDTSTLCVVESIRDLIAIEETQSFRGIYHVLGGIISPLEGVGPENLEIDSLLRRVDTLKINEIVMALSPTIDGETTIFYINRLLEGRNIELSTIARGVSFGGDLEYADEFTLGRSIKARLPYQQKQML